MLTNALNFMLVVLMRRAPGGISFRDAVEHAFLPVLPAEFATGLLTAGVAFIYGRIGVGAVGLARRRDLRLPVPLPRRRAGVRAR